MLDEVGKTVVDDATAGRANDVTNKENAHGLN
jgi:hypothetical protein